MFCVSILWSMSIRNRSRCYLLVHFFFKGSVSWILRWVLLYINRKLSLRPIIKGLVHNLHKTGRRTLVQTILKSEKNVGMSNIEMRNSPSELYYITEKYLFAILPVFLMVLWGPMAHMKAIPHFNMVDKCYFRDINTHRGACCTFQYCESVLKCGRIFEEQKNSSWPQFVRYQFKIFHRL